MYSFYPLYPVFFDLRSLSSIVPFSSSPGPGRLSIDARGGVPNRRFRRGGRTFCPWSDMPAGPLPFWPSWPFKTAQDRLKSPQEQTKSPQDRPKTSQEPPKTASRSPRSDPRSPKTGPRSPRATQDRPKSPQDQPKTPQERPKSHLEPSWTGKMHQNRALPSGFAKPTKTHVCTNLALLGRQNNQK